MSADNNHLSKSSNWWWMWGALTTGLLLSGLGPLGVGQSFRLMNDVDPRFLNLAWLSALAWLVGIGVAVSNQVVNKRRERKGAGDLTGFNDNLSDVHKAIADLLKSKRDGAARDAFFGTMVRKANSLFQLDGVRVCVYELEEDQPENKGEDPTIILRLIASGGRSDDPRGEFTRETLHGSAAIDVSLGTSYVSVSDPHNSDHPVQRDPNAEWRSFFAVPLRDKHKPRGLLTIDTRTPTQFRDEDVAIARTIGGLLVLGMSELLEAAVETLPEVTKAMELLAELDRAESTSPDTAPAQL